MNLDSFRIALLRLAPKRFRLPLRYYYHFVSGTLNKELKMLEHLVTTRKTAIDIGANVGLWSYALSKIFVKVEAFEPIADCIEELVAYNNKKINIHNCALSSTGGERKLHIPIDGNNELATFENPHWQYRTSLVKVHSLDDYNFSNVSFIKIDVEGHELEVIKGAEKTIKREKPVMVIEIEQRHLEFPMTVVFDKIWSLGYEGFFIWNGREYAYSEFSYEVHQKPFLSDPMSPHHVNNFIFKPL